MALAGIEEELRTNNAPWDREREAPADRSVLFLNKRLVKEGPDVWDEIAIENRAQWLYGWTVKIWPH